MIFTVGEIVLDIHAKRLGRVFRVDLNSKFPFWVEFFADDGARTIKEYSHMELELCDHVELELDRFKFRQNQNLYQGRVR